MPTDLGPLGGAFLPHAPPELAQQLDDARAAELEDALSALLSRAQAAWPELGLPPADFLRHVAERLRGEPLAALSALHGEDLYLACACAQGLPAALAAFDARFLSQVPALLSAERLAPEVIDEVCQQLRARYLVALPDGPPRIAEYSGRGRLLGWVRVAALHLSLNLFRNRDDQIARQEGADPALLLAPGDDQELEYLRRRYQPEFKAAFQEALAALPDRQRELLRMSVVHGLSIDKIAPLYQTSRATAARWLAAARQAVLDDLHRRLRERLRLSPSEVESLARVLRSQLQISLARYLGEG
jgi:RNA polymerase sigma-70 factor, ECF subfamily